MEINTSEGSLKGLLTPIPGMSYTRMKTLKIGRNTYEYTHVEVLGVLAGAYRGRALENRTLRTHLVLMRENRTVRTGCRMDPGRLVDKFGMDEPEGTPPTCPTCARMWDKLETTKG